MKSPATRRARFFPMTLAASLEGTVMPLCKKHGFAEHRILTQWHVIVGAALARTSAPYKISFRSARSGTLHVKVHPGKVLELQYLQAAIIEQVNRYFGYAAIERLVLLQDHRWAQPRTEKTAGPPRALAPSAVTHALKACTDPELRLVLATLGEALTKAEK